MHRPLLRAFAPLVAGPLVWAGHFLFIYALNGVRCARPGMEAFWLGIALPSWAIGIAGLLALAAIGLFHSRLRAHLSASGDARFLRSVAGGLNLLSAVAVSWQTAPVLLLPACG